MLYLDICYNVMIVFYFIVHLFLVPYGKDHYFRKQQYYEQATESLLQTHWTVRTIILFSISLG